MSILTVVKKIELKEGISQDDVLIALERAISRDFDKIKIRKNEANMLDLSSRVKTSILNPVVAIKGRININTNGKYTKIMIDCDVKTTGWFWFQFILSLIPIFYVWGWLLLCYQWTSQKKSSVASLRSSIDRIEFYLCDV